MKSIALLIATALAAGIVIFYSRNPEIVHIDLLMGKISVSLSSALLGSGLLGAMTGGVLVAVLKQRTTESEVGGKKEIMMSNFSG
jgi:uncharacterized integral membrane protein